MAGQKVIKDIEVRLSLIAKKTNNVKELTNKLSLAKKEMAGITGLAKKNKVSFNQMEGALRSQGAVMDKSGKFIQKNGEAFKNLDKTVQKGLKSTQKFNMNALGVMFAGMAIQKAFSGMATAATTAFTKIMESNNMMGTAVQQAAVGFEYLKFTIGSAINTALMPMMPAIMSIISAIAEWVQVNPELTFGIIAFGFALGTTLFIIGQANLGLVALGNWLGATSGAAGLGSAAIAVFALAVIAAIDAFKVLRAGTGKEMIDWSVNTESAFGAVIDIIGIGLLGVVAGIISIGRLIWESLSFMYNSLAIFFKAVANIAILQINLLIDGWNALMNTDIKHVKYLDIQTNIDDISNDLDSFKQDMTDIWNPKSENSTFSKEKRMQETLGPGTYNKKSGTFTQTKEQATPMNTTQSTSLGADTIDFLNKTASGGNTVTYNIEQNVVVEKETDKDGIIEAMDYLKKELEANQ